MEPQSGVPHEETRGPVLTVFAVVTIVIEVFSNVSYEREREIEGGGCTTTHFHLFVELNIKSNSW